MLLPHPLKKLIEAANRLSDAVNNQVNATREANQDRDKQSCPEPKSVLITIAERVEVKKCAADARQDGEYQTRSLRWQIALTLFTAGAFAAATYYACVARQQRDTMDKTLTQMQQQTGLLQTQVEAAMGAVLFKQFRISWPAPQSAHLSVILDNRGRVAASKISGVVEIMEASLPKDKLIKAYPDWHFVTSDLNPSPELPHETGTDLLISQDDLKGSDGMPKVLRLSGQISYFNGFSQKTDVICLYLIGEAEFRDKTGVVRETRPAGTTDVSCGSLPALIGDYRQESERVLGQ